MTTVWDSSAYYRVPGEKSQWPESASLQDVPHDIYVCHRTNTRIITFRPPKVPSPDFPCFGCRREDCSTAQSCLELDERFLKILDWLFAVARPKKVK